MRTVSPIASIASKTKLLIGISVFCLTLSALFIIWAMQVTKPAVALLQNPFIDHYLPAEGVAFVQGDTIRGNDGDELYTVGMNLGQWLVLEGYLWELGPHEGQTYENNFAEHQIRLGLDHILVPTGVSTEAFVRDYRDVFITRDDIAFLKEAGVNLLRIPFHAKDFVRADDGNIPEEAFVYLDRAMGWCEEFELYCMLDHHSAAETQSTLPHADSVGEAMFWHMPDSQQEAIDLLVDIGMRYNGNPWLYGIDLLNESQAPSDVDLAIWYAKAIDELRLSGYGHIILVQPNNISLNIESVLQIDSGVQYAPHFYGFGRSAAEENAKLFDQMTSLGVPVLIGEVGNWAEDWWARHSDKYILYRYLAHGVPITYWNYKDMIADNTGSFGLVRGDTNDLYQEFARALESGTQLRADFPIDELLTSFQTVAPTDRPNVVKLISDLSLDAPVMVPSSSAAVLESIQKDPAGYRSAEQIAEYISDVSAPYWGCAGKTVGECLWQKEVD